MYGSIDQSDEEKESLLPPRLKRRQHNNTNSYDNYSRGNSHSQNDISRVLERDQLGGNIGEIRDSDEPYPSTLPSHLDSEFGVSSEELITTMSTVFQRSKYHETTVEVLEVMPSGESGYRLAKTLRELLDYIKESIQKFDDVPVRPPEQSRSSSLNDERRKRKPVKDLQLIDLRILESHQIYRAEQPVILIRKHVVVINFPPIRAIIMADKLLLLVPNGADSLLYLFQEHLHGLLGTYDQISAEQLSPEIHFFKAILATIFSLQSQEFVSLEATVEKALFNPDLDHRAIQVQEVIRKFLNITNSQLARNASYSKLLNTLHNCDEDLSLMNLSAFRAVPGSYTGDGNEHQISSPEMTAATVDMFLMDFRMLGSKLMRLDSKLRGQQDVMRISLTRSQNDLFVVYMVIMSINVVVVACTYPISMFSSNLHMGINNEYSYPVVFWGITTILLLVISFASYLVHRFYVLQRVQFR